MAGRKRLNALDEPSKCASAERFNLTEVKDDRLTLDVVQERPFDGLYTAVAT
ncbi:hypothetical protein [Roseateles sp. BYS87W]|uniref:Uncharacterized protein n=1 Tax=Pelomonas baiyunensis TaxID=3299026 RepID=A0ABW7GXT0_9BURK